jgi:hypothetical protein
MDAKGQCELKMKCQASNELLKARMKYRIQEPGTTISGFADKKKLMPTDRP